MKYLKLYEDYNTTNNLYDMIYDLLYSVNEGEISIHDKLLRIIHEIGNDNQIAMFIINNLKKTNIIETDDDLANIQEIEIAPDDPKYFAVYFTKPDGGKYMTLMKIGKVINKIVTAIKQNRVDISNEDIEKFVSKVYSKSGYSSDEYDLKIVSGEDIRKYYLGENCEYYGGSLGNSCMLSSEVPNIEKKLEFYTRYPDTIKLVIRVNKKTDKIIGRALLWCGVKTEDGSVVDYLDRIYVVDNNDVELFKEYVKKTYPKVKYFSATLDSDMGLYIHDEIFSIELKHHGDLSHMPSLDTFDTWLYKMGSDTITFTNKRYKRNDSKLKDYDYLFRIYMGVMTRIYQCDGNKPAISVPHTTNPLDVIKHPDINSLFDVGLDTRWKIDDNGKLSKLP